MLRVIAPLTLVALIPLMACSPAERCRLRATAQIRSLDRQIQQSETDIARGYRIEEFDSPFDFGFGMCLGQRDRVCAEGPVQKVVPINVEAERAKLANLKEQRARAEPAAQTALAACPAPAGKPGG